MSVEAERLAAWSEGYRDLRGMDQERIHEAWVKNEDEPRVLLMSDVRAVLAHVAALEAERDELRDLLERMRDWCLSGDEPDAPDGTPTLLDKVNAVCRPASTPSENGADRG